MGNNCTIHGAPFKEKESPPRAGAIGGDRSRASTCECQKRRTRKNRPAVSPRDMVETPGLQQPSRAQIVSAPPPPLPLFGVHAADFRLSHSESRVSRAQRSRGAEPLGADTRLTESTVPWAAEGGRKSLFNQGTVRSGAHMPCRNQAFGNPCRSPCVTPQRLPRMQPRTLHRWQCLVFQGFFT